MGIEQHVADNYATAIANEGRDAVRDRMVKTGADDVVAWIDETFPAETKKGKAEKAAAPIEKR